MPDSTPPKILARIGRRVRRERQDLDLSIRELAERSGLSPRFVSDVESGSGNIAVGRLERIADALEVPLSALVRETGPAGAREAIDDLLDGRSEEELLRLRHTLEITLGRRRPKVIALLGIRGAGKSTVGPELGRRLSIPFIELDKRIEALAGMGPEDLFAFHGEPHYRQLEGRCLAELVADDTPCIVALPGGVVGNEDALALLRATCFTVWLEAKADDYWQRVFEQGDTRPTEGREHAMDDLRRLVETREPLYRRSDLVVDTSGRSPDQVVEGVLTGLERNRIF